MASTTITVDVDEADKERLEALARSMGRSSSLLATEAISEYLAVNEWQIAATGIAIESLDRGEHVTHEAVRDWVESWGLGEREPPPARRT